MPCTRIYGQAQKPSVFYLCIVFVHKNCVLPSTIQNVKLTQKEFRLGSVVSSKTTVYEIKPEWEPH